MVNNPDNKKVGGEFDPVGIVINSGVIGAIIYGLTLLINKNTSVYLSPEAMAIGNFVGNVIVRTGVSLTKLAYSRIIHKK